MDRGKLKESDFRKIDIGAAPMTADTAMASWPSSSGHGALESRVQTMLASVAIKARHGQKRASFFLSVAGGAYSEDTVSILQDIY